jgi:hypothetical protein
MALLPHERLLHDAVYSVAENVVHVCLVVL